MLISWNLIEELPQLMTRIFIAPSFAAEFLILIITLFSEKATGKILILTYWRRPGALPAWAPGG
jgi:hypothetical protein